MHGHDGQLPGGYTSIRAPCQSIHVCVQHVFFNLVGNTNTINMCLILSTIYIFIPVSSCVGRGPGALLIPGSYNAVKTALPIWLSYSKDVKSKCYLKHPISITVSLNLCR
jgi:hypothetical protein